MRTSGEELAEVLDGRVVLGEAERRGVVGVAVHRRRLARHALDHHPCSIQQTAYIKHASSTAGLFEISLIHC